MKQLRLVHVGIGFFGASWATDIVAAASKVAPAGWVDANPQALEAFQTANPAAAGHCFSDLGEALDTVECDAVLVTTSTPSHYPLARLALERGKHVLVEKPFTQTLEQARDLVDLAKAKGLVVAVSQNYRHHPAVRAAADLLRSGRFGPVVAASITFRNNAARFPGFGSYHIDDPLLADLAIHHFDQLRFLTQQEAVEVSCRTWNPPTSKFKAPPSGAATIVLAGGAIATYQGSWSAHAPETPYGGSWIVECADAALVFETRWRMAHPRAGDWLQIVRLGEEVEEVALDALEYVDRHGTLNAFADAILTGSEPPGFSSGTDNLGSLAILDAARNSAAQEGALVGVAF